MSKNNKRVAIETLVKMAHDLGIPMEEMKSGWIKLQGDQGRRIYIQKQQAVSRVDLAGWPEEEGPGKFVPAEDRPSGAVTRQILFAEHTVEDFLASLTSVHDPNVAPVRSRSATKVSLAGILSGLQK